MRDLYRTNDTEDVFTYQNYFSDQYNFSYISYRIVYRHTMLQRTIVLGLLKSSDKKISFGVQ